MQKARQQSILAFRGSRYLWAALVLCVASIGAYAWHAPDIPPNGGTWLGYTLGTVGAVLVLWLMSFGIRKRAYASRAGTVQGWLSAHIYLGMSLLVIVTLHAGFQVGWNVHTLAYVLMFIVVLSGTVTVVAGTIKLMASAGTVAQNSPFTVNLVLDASDPLVPGTHPGLFSGQVIVNFDITKLTYTGFTLASGLSYYLSPVVATNGNTRTVHLGFNGAAEIGTVGTFSFTAIGSPGSVATIGLADGDPVPGSFVNTLPTNQRFIPTPTGAQVNIVPAPAGVWLLGTAVGALVIRRRRRHAAA